MLRSIIRCISLSLSLVLCCMPAIYAASTDKPVIEPKSVDYDVDRKEWGIQNGCINTNRLRSMKFLTKRTALLEMLGNKYILMTLDRSCPGVLRGGVSYETRNSRLCERFDRITSIETGVGCGIKYFEPYIQPIEDPGREQ